MIEAYNTESNETYFWVENIILLAINNSFISQDIDETTIEKNVTIIE